MTIKRIVVKQKENNAFYCHVYHRSLCVISYLATIAKEKRVFTKLNKLANKL